MLECLLLSEQQARLQMLENILGLLKRKKKTKQKKPHKNPLTWNQATRWTAIMLFN